MPSLVTLAFVAALPPPCLVWIFGSKVPFLPEIRCDFYMHCHMFSAERLLVLRRCSRKFR